MMNFLQTIGQRFLPLLMVALVLAGLGTAGFMLTKYAPEVKRLVGVQVQHSPNNRYQTDGAVLGWEELGQYSGASSAEKSHLKIRYQRNARAGQVQGWQLQNVAAKKKVDARTSLLPTRFVRRFALKTGDRLITKSFTLEVQQADNGQLVLLDRNKNVTARWLGTRLAFSDQRTLYPYCERKGIRALVSGWRDSVYWKWFRQDSKDEKRLFSVGGQVDCTTRWAQANVAPDSLRFLAMNGRFWVGAGRSTLRVLIERGRQKYDLNSVPLAVNGEDGQVNRLILGRTHYEVTANAKELSLVPTRNQPVFIQQREAELQQAQAALNGEQRDAVKSAAEKAKQDAAKRIEAMKDRGIFPYYQTYAWIGDIPSGRAVSTVNIAIAWAITLLLASFVVLFRQGYHGVTYGLRFTGLLVTIGLSVLVTILVMRKASLGTLLSLAWLLSVWATAVQFLSGRLRDIAARIWALGLLLAGIGVLVLTQLAVGSDNTRWLHFPSETAFWLTQLAIWVALLSLAPLENVLDALMRLLHPEQHRLQVGKLSLPHAAYLSLLAGVVLLLFAQSLGGKEEGVFGIQPVELAKFTFIIAMARLLWFLRNIRTVYSEYYQQNRYAIPITLFIRTFAVVLLGAFLLAFGVNDNSPVFIVGFLSLAFFWLALIDPLEPNSRSQRIRQGGIIAFVLLIIGTGVIMYFDPPDYNSHFPQAERFRSWSNPLLYPEAASQLLNSLQRVGEGGWFGTGWFGKNGVVMSLPAVQDDFIAAFMLNRFGGFMGMLLIAVQFIWLLSLFKLSKWLRTIEASRQVEAAFQLLGYVVYGLAWVHLLHWLISWSNVLGWLPIMGQPMTWLSAGNSHLLAIGMPTLLFGLLAAWVRQVD